MLTKIIDLLLFVKNIMQVNMYLKDNFFTPKHIYKFFIYCNKYIFIIANGTQYTNIIHFYLKPKEAILVMYIYINATRYLCTVQGKV